MKQNIISPKHVINIKTVGGLNKITVDDKIHIGALSKIKSIEKSSILLENCKIITVAASHIAYVQIQNIGTIGGNICNASPASDFAPVLMILDSKVEITNSQEKKVLSICDFFCGPGKTLLAANEILTGIRIPKQNNGGKGVFKKICSGTTRGCAIVNLAMLADIEDSNKTINDIRIAVGAMGPTPIRCLETEKFLAGNKIEKNVLIEACCRLVDETAPISDIRASKDFRISMIKAIFNGAIFEVSGGIEGN
jgi:CO/xanthine dehydrogenase FAD-binding subunit